jgi:dimethylhistidine N-methyltransferase
MTALARTAIVIEPPVDAESAFARDVLHGLSAAPKSLPPKYFYDAAGSALFEAITQLPEYYLTRTELGILQASAPQIARLVPPNAALVEFGSGATTKARILLRAAATFAAYVPVDISAEFLGEEAIRLERDFPRLAVIPVAADFMAPFELPAQVSLRPRIGFFPGSTIGNFEPPEAAALFCNVARVLGRGATLIIGIDLAKDEAVLNAAYNDAAGVTAKFNLNLLARINRELGADFDLASFHHRAFYNRERRRIEMHLQSARSQNVKVAGRTIAFRAGETIHTENSYKFTIEGFAAFAQRCGWTPRAVWTDPDRYFSVHAFTFIDEACLRPI